MSHPFDEQAESLLDRQRLAESDVLAHLEYRAEVDSTNTLALRLAADSQFPTPALVIADRQTAGRGRGSNRWWSAAGALTFSLVLEPSRTRLAPKDWPRSTLATALAICEAVELAAPGERCLIKWPNDVYLQSRKLAGLLVEVASRGEAPPRLVLGLGINVNNALGEAPEEVRDRAISLVDATSQRYDLTEFLLTLIQQIQEEMVLLAAGHPEQPARWQSRNLLDGRQVVVSQPTRDVVGRVLEIREDGALLVATERGVEALLSGTVASIE